MAARENQGLQIALIIFVLLTLLLSVTTFVFVRKSNTEGVRADTAEQTGAKDRQERDKMREERGQLMQYIGLAADEKIETATEAWTKDMKSAEAYGVTNLPADQKSYKKLVEGLHTVVRSRNAQLAKQEGDFRNAKETFDKKTNEYQEQIQSLTNDKTAAVNDYLKERARIGEHVTTLNEGRQQLVDANKAKAQEITDVKAQMDTKVSTMEKDLQKTQQQIKLQAEHVNKLEGKFAINANADGKIIWVNERDRVAFITLGSADGLRKRVTFSVYEPATTDVSALPTKDEDGNVIENKSQVSEAHKKGSIEVVNILQPHMAECRILADSTTNPILPGDLVFTPLWRPGKQDHFAFVGLMDIDGDGKQDKEKIRDLIRTNGGVIDAEIDDKGNLVGEVTPLTRYIVKGSTEGTANQAGPNKLIEDATKLGVESVDLAKFLDMMGYTPPLDDDKIVRGRTPRAPSAGEPNANFRQRIPPERGSKGGGF